jgi:hypothetical protein
MAKTPKKTRSTSSSVDPATQYAKDVTSGKELAGPDIRNACQRHLRDLESCHARGLHWDVEAAQRSIDYFAKVLKLNGAILKVRLLFCCHGSVSSSVRFLAGKMPEVFAGSEWFTWNQERIWQIPLSAGIGLYCLTADKEPRAEVYAAATKKTRQWSSFVMRWRWSISLRLFPHAYRNLAAPERVEPGFLQAGSFFRPISSDDGQSGPRPHCALIDEVHEHKSNQVVEMMRAGTKGRRQALIFMITNSGHDKTSVCYDYHEYGRKVSAGSIEDDSFLPLFVHWMKVTILSRMSPAGKRLTPRWVTRLKKAIFVSR